MHTAIARAFIITIFCTLPSFAQVGAQPDIDRCAQLTRIELHFFHRSNTGVSDQKRQEKLELLVFGDIQEGDVPERMKRLEKALNSASQSKAQKIY